MGQLPLRSVRDIDHPDIVRRCHTALEMTDLAPIRGPAWRAANAHFGCDDCARRPTLRGDDAQIERPIVILDIGDPFAIRGPGRITLIRISGSDLPRLPA